MIDVLDKNDDYFTGTGFFISPNRILTCEHLLDEAFYATIRFEDDPDSEIIFNKDITILKIDKKNDLALLEVDIQHPFHLSLEEKLECRPGQPVYTVGFPLGRNRTASAGIISTKLFRESQIGFTAPVSPGSSGSPLLNQNGNVVGVFISYDGEGQNMNAAVDIKTIRAFLAQPDKPFKLSSENYASTEDSTLLMTSVLKTIKNTGLKVIIFVLVTGLVIFFTVVGIISLLVVFLLLCAAAKAIFRSFAEGTYKQKLKKPFLVFLSSSMLIIWLIIGISLYNLLFLLVGKDGFVVSTAVVGTSIIIGTIFYFMMKKIWKRYSKTA